MLPCLLSTTHIGNYTNNITPFLQNEGELESNHKEIFLEILQYKS